MFSALSIPNVNTLSPIRIRSAEEISRVKIAREKARCAHISRVIESYIAGGEARPIALNCYGLSESALDELQEKFLSANFTVEVAENAPHILNISAPTSPVKGKEAAV